MTMNAVDRATRAGMQARAAHGKSTAPGPPPPPPSEPPPLRSLYGDTPTPAAEYVTTQQLAPIFVAMVRGIYSALVGAAAGAGIAIAAGVTEWDKIGLAALGGALTGFAGRTGEAALFDTPRTASVTEKVA